MREYRANLIVEAKRLCRDDSAAEDLAMKTIEVYMSKPEEELPPAEKSLAYLKSILRNIYHDSVRGKAQACMVYLDPEDIERLDELGPADNSTEEAILAHSDAELVRNAIARLPESARAVIVMHYFESLSIRQIAELIKKSPDSVKSNLYYARKVLAKRLGKAFGRAALAVAALLFGGSLLYAAAVATGLAPSPFVGTDPTQAPIAESSGDSPPGGSGDSPQGGSEEITANFSTNNEENAMNVQSVKSAAVKTLAAGAMLAATTVSATTIDPSSVFSASPITSQSTTSGLRGYGQTAIVGSAGAVQAEARSVSISGTSGTGSDTVFQLAFGAGTATNRLYLAYGAKDGGDDPDAWEHLTEIAEIQPGTASYSCSAPAGWGTDVNYLRFFLGVRVSLPYDYAVEYLQSSGKEYFDTDVVRASTISAELDIKVDSAANGATDLFGFRQSGVNCMFWCSSGRKFAINFGSHDSGYVNACDLSVRCRIRNDNSNIYYNDELVYTGSVQSFTGGSAQTLVMFAAKTSAQNVENRQLAGKLYGLKIWDGGALVRDYVPCVKDGLVGVWDNVNSTFTISITASQFTAGPQSGCRNGEFSSVQSTASVAASVLPLVAFSGEVDAAGDGTASIRYTLCSAGENASAAEVRVAWGTSPEALVGSAVVSAAAGSGESGVAVISGLDPETRYYARITASSSAGDSAAATPVEFFTPAASASVRTLTVTGTNVVENVIKSLELSFSSSAETNWLYMACGPEEGGDDVASWSNLVFVAEIAPYQRTLSCPVPDGWGSDVFALCFFLGEPVRMPYDYAVEYLESSAVQGINLQRHWYYGETLSVVWRQAALAGLTEEDKGWGTGSGSSNITCGGRRKNSRLSAYINSGHRYFMPDFPVSELNTTDIFRDIVSVSTPVSFAMTRIGGGPPASWELSESVTMPNGTAFDSGTPIYLFRDSDRNPYYGKKAIYRATLTSNATDEVIFDYIPVVKDGVPCFYDLVSGVSRYNCNMGYFAVGPKLAAPVVAATNFTARSAMVSLLGEPLILLSGTTVNHDMSVAIDWNAVTLAGRSSVAISVLWGLSADGLSSSNLLAAAATEGPGSATFSGMTPGRMYYARLVAYAEGKEPSYSAIVQVAMPALPVWNVQSSRSFKIAEVLRTGSVVSGARLEIGPGAHTNVLYAAYGPTYGGDTTNGWAHVAELALIPGAASEYTVAMPQGWGAESKYIRFFLIDAERPFDYRVEYLESTAEQMVTIPTNMVYGHAFTLVWRQASLTGLANEDKGWGTGCSAGTNITGGGRRRDGYISPYIVGANRSFSPEMTASELTTNVIYRDEAKIAEKIYYSMTDTETDETRSISLAVPNIEDFSSESYIALFRDYQGAYPDWGRKAIYRATLSDAFTGEKIYDLYPVVKDCVGRYYDPNTGSFMANSGAALLIGPAKTDETDFMSATGTLVAENPSLPELGAVAVSGLERGDRVTASGALVRDGGSACTITVETSRIGDFTDKVVWTCPEPIRAGGEFKFELYDPNPESDAYITPGGELHWRVRAVNESAGEDVSPTDAFTTGAASVGLDVNMTAHNGRQVTFTVELDSIGANTTEVWVVWSTGTSALDNRSESAIFAFDSAAKTATVTASIDSFRMLYYALAVSNGCSTASWMTTGATKSVVVSDNTVYTWKKSVSSGSWSDASNWVADADARGEAPSDASTAFFPSGTTTTVFFAEIGCAASLIDLTAADVNVVFTGGRTENRLTTGTFAFTGDRTTVTFTNFWMRANGGGINAGVNARMKLWNAYVSFGSGASSYFAQDGCELVLENDSFFYSASMVALSRTAKATVRNSSLSVGNGRGLLTLAYGADGGSIVLGGASPILSSGAIFNQYGREGGTIEFEVPVGGYAVSTLQGAMRPLGRDTSGAHTNAPVALAFSPSSPILSSSRGRRAESRLFIWTCGVDQNAVAFPRRSATMPELEMIFSGESDEPYKWSKTPGESVYSVGVAFQRLGGALFVR